jgi:hypothetical protein
MRVDRYIACRKRESVMVISHRKEKRIVHEWARISTNKRRGRGVGDDRQ